MPLMVFPPLLPPEPTTIPDPLSPEILPPLECLLSPFPPVEFLRLPLPLASEDEEGGAKIPRAAPLGMGKDSPSAGAGALLVAACWAMAAAKLAAASESMGPSPF